MYQVPGAVASTGLASSTALDSGVDISFVFFIPKWRIAVIFFASAITSEVTEMNASKLTRKLAFAAALVASGSFASAPLALSLLLVWPVRLAIYGDDLFRSGGSDTGTGEVVLTDAVGTLLLPCLEPRDLRVTLGVLADVSAPLSLSTPLGRSTATAW